MSLPVALALLALLVATFTLLAVSALYTRLRLLEATALAPGSARLADEELRVPEGLRSPGGSLVLLLDGACSVCHDLAAAGADVAGVRVVALFATAAGAASVDDLPGLERVVDARAWAALSEGYTPCVFTADGDGLVTDRRFVYGDTDMAALFDPGGTRVA